MSQLQIDDVLLDAVIRGTKEGLETTGLQPPPVGASRFYTAGRPIAVMVGLVGRTNGTRSISMSERALLHLASKLIGEVGNRIAWRVKECLAGTDFETANISVPSARRRGGATRYATGSFRATTSIWPASGLMGLRK
jgi:hypothetical protein